MASLGPFENLRVGIQSDDMRHASMSHFGRQDPVATAYAQYPSRLFRDRPEYQRVIVDDGITRSV